MRDRRAPLGLTYRGRKQEGVGATLKQSRPQKLLRLRAEVQRPRFSPVRAFVVLEPDFPHGLASVKIRSPQCDDLARPGAAQELQIHHGADGGR